MTNKTKNGINNKSLSKKQKFAKNGAPTIMIKNHSQRPTLTETLSNRINALKQENGNLFVLNTTVPNQMMRAAVDGKVVNDYLGATAKAIDSSNIRATVGWTRKGNINFYPNGWGGNQHTQVATVSKIGGAVDKVSGAAGNVLDVASIYVAYQDGGSKGAAKEAFKTAGGKFGAKVTTMALTPVCVAAGAVTYGVGGVACFVFADRGGDAWGGKVSELMFDDYYVQKEKWEQMSDKEKAQQIQKWADPEIKQFNKDMEEYRKANPPSSDVKIGE